MPYEETPDNLRTRRAFRAAGFDDALIDFTPNKSWGSSQEVWRASVEGGGFVSMVKLMNGWEIHHFNRGSVEVPGHIDDGDGSVEQAVANIAEHFREYGLRLRH